MESKMVELAIQGYRYLQNQDIEKAREYFKQALEGPDSEDIKSILETVPVLKMATEQIAEEEVRITFGVSLEKLDRLFYTYDVYHMIESSSIPLDTKDMMMRSARIEDGGIQRLKEVLAALNNAGYIAYDNREFRLVTEAYKAEKAQSQLAKVEADMERAKEQLQMMMESEQCAKDTILENERQIEELRNHARQLLNQSQEKGPANLNTKESTIQGTQNEIQQLEQLRQSKQAEVMAERVKVAQLINQKQSMEREMKAVPFFQTKKRKEMQMQIMNLNILLSRNEGVLNSRQEEAAAIARQIAAKNQQIQTLNQEIHVISHLDENAFLDTESVAKCEAVIAENRVTLQDLEIRIRGRKKKIESLQSCLEKQEWVPTILDKYFNDGYEYEVEDPYIGEPDEEARFESKEDLAEYIRTHFKPQMKIAAIKYYREQTGAGLAEAKAAVEAIF